MKLVDVEIYTGRWSERTAEYHVSQNIKHFISHIMSEKCQCTFSAEISIMTTEMSILAP